MADALTTITNLIQSPPGQLVAGGALAGIVWKFFERVEAVLTDNTKLEIAVWLVGINVKPKVQKWPEYFAQVFRVWFSVEEDWLEKWLDEMDKGIFNIPLRAVVSSCVSLLLVFSLIFVFSGRAIFYRFIPHSSFEVAISFSGAFLYGAVLLGCSELAFITGALRAYFDKRLRDAVKNLLPKFCFAAFWGFALIWGAYTSAADVDLAERMRRSGDHWWFLAAFWKGQREIWAYPFSRDHLEGYALLFGVTLVPLIWLGLFTVAGLAIVVARRFDIGFQWFNRKFDIEKKPLQSIGLVAGSLVAIAYWSAVIVKHVWK